MINKALLLFCSLFSVASLSMAQNTYVSAGTNDTIRVAAINVNGEIMPWIVLKEVVVADYRRFATKEDYDRFRRLRYNVIKVLPYARFAGQRYRQLERDLATTSDKRKQKQYVKDCDKEIKDLFNREVKNLTISQGEILIKLIDRETQHSSYELVRDLKGNVSAFVMQSVAKLFGHDLKNKYDVDQERDIEAIIRSTGYYSYQ
ncbi:hypothetical protein BCY91_05340 [Pelobium manganitolerans]|uniref:DUF4294 domain-containing protein n=1 Tax=Pelobium manganitolerans TaxID=1842495 RepID=A0A419S632_9SPHI|nr:DUF4294 domain-containing protein [Pelobium manganitolerans]RKD16295.1 hypothetical protein BCY91_05340 [Pelobium manganitolerans]